MDETEETTTFKVLVNEEEQYSLWPARREPPPGWQDTGKRGTKAACVSFINDAWVDLRPLSLRKRMANKMSAGGDN
jgi:MbtH protein